MTDVTTRNPVLLLHGIDDTETKMAPLGEYLRARGWTVCSLSLSPNDGSCSLAALAADVAAGVAQHFPPGQPFHLVCFSMGGIIGRYYLQRLGGVQQVQRFITISSPHHGTLTGYLRAGEGCRQLCPGSAFLNDLNQDFHTLSTLDVTSIWSPFDLMIVPAWSSRLPFGRDVIVPVLIHPWLTSDPRVFAEVEKALKK